MNISCFLSFLLPLNENRITFNFFSFFLLPLNLDTFYPEVLLRTLTFTAFNFIELTYSLTKYFPLDLPDKIWWRENRFPLPSELEKVTKESGGDRSRLPVWSLPFT